jgi:hypothetical protein
MTKMNASKSEHCILQALLPLGSAGGAMASRLNSIVVVSNNDVPIGVTEPVIAASERIVDDSARTAPVRAVALVVSKLNIQCELL